MAEAAGRVLAAPGDYRHLGAAGVELVRDRYSLDVCLPRMLDLYRNAAGASAGDRRGMCPGSPADAPAEVPTIAPIWVG